MSSEQLPIEPRPNFLVEAEIDSYRNSAETSIAWNEKLSNPGKLKQVGRFLLNSVGVESPDQQAARYHEGIIQNYADSIAVESDRVKLMSDEEHVDARQKVIAARVEAGDVVINPLPNTEITYVGMTPMKAPRQLGIKHQLNRMHNPESMPAGVRRLKVFGKKGR